MRIRLGYLLMGLLAMSNVWGQTSYTFSDGGKRVEYQLSATEIFSSGDVVPLARDHVDWGGGKVYTLESTGAMKHLLASSDASRKSMSPVLYYKGDLPSEEKLAAMADAERAQ